MTWIVIIKCHFADALFSLMLWPAWSTCRHVSPRLASHNDWTLSSGGQAPSLARLKSISRGVVVRFVVNQTMKNWFMAKLLQFPILTLTERHAKAVGARTGTHLSTLSMTTKNCSNSRELEAWHCSLVSLWVIPSSLKRCPGALSCPRLHVVCMAKEHHKPVTQPPHMHETNIAGIMVPCTANHQTQTRSCNCLLPQPLPDVMMSATLRGQDTFDEAWIILCSAWSRGHVRCLARRGHVAYGPGAMTESTLADTRGPCGPAPVVPRLNEWVRSRGPNGSDTASEWVRTLDLELAGLSDIWSYFKEL